MQRSVVPLSQRPVDIVILVFFLINLLFITYVVDLEQLVIADPNNFQYPIWPPAQAVDAVHWWGRTYDPVLLARPAWWKATLWIDALFFGPFYLAGLYAFAAGKEWIRIPSIIYSSMLLTNVIIILNEEAYGRYASPHLPIVLLANLPWLVFPLLIIGRLWRSPHPFTRAAAKERSAPAGALPALSEKG